MKFRKPSRKELLSSCSEIRPDDGVDPRTFFRDSSRKGTNRKALQMCHEVARTLNAVLAWETSDDLLRCVVVDAVEPAPDSTRVLVTLSVQSPTAQWVNPSELMDHLRRSRGRFRTEIAAAINRKRVPELVFRLVEAKGGTND